MILFRGRLLLLNGQEIQLQLSNGQYMTAKLEAQMQLALGQILNFEVQSNENNRIVLKPLYTNLLQQQVGEAALRAGLTSCQFQESTACVNDDREWYIHR